MAFPDTVPARLTVILVFLARRKLTFLFLRRWENAFIGREGVMHCIAKLSYGYNDITRVIGRPMRLLFGNIAL